MIGSGFRLTFIDVFRRIVIHRTFFIEDFTYFSLHDFQISSGVNFFRHKKNDSIEIGFIRVAFPLL